MDKIGGHETDDNARFIEDAGELAPWSSGAVGTYGASQPGGHQIPAATGPDHHRLDSLKALVIGQPVAGSYEQWNHDGVPRPAHAPQLTIPRVGPSGHPTIGPARSSHVPHKYEFGITSTHPATLQLASIVDPSKAL